VEREIEVGDWIAFPVNGLEAQGEVLSVEDEGYGVRQESGGVTFVPKGDRVRRIEPPQRRE
jgi:hypothetical protein